MAWTVTVSAKARKGIDKLPEAARKALALLMKDMEAGGPVRGDWPNYGKLGNRRHHCHIKKGQPTYVVVWEEVSGRVRLIEVTYVGSHEKAPY
ncbi:MAG: cytotoxic translational repressor of toxin-antitoxin stability system [Desulfarculus sp.]|nr:cytotoxic translational repressor of toxin-antitoxin stability system [Desulfarculus sp.]